LENLFPLFHSFLASSHDAVLAVTRSFIGSAIFNLLTWIYFSPHFIKAELFFNQKTRGTATKIYYLFPPLALSTSHLRFLGGKGF
jgi:hypothetical protein